MSDSQWRQTSLRGIPVFRGIFRAHDLLDRFQKSRAFLLLVEGAIFLMKMALCRSGSGVQLFWNRYSFQGNRSCIPLACDGRFPGR